MNVGICDMVVIKSNQSLEIYKKDSRARVELEQHRKSQKQLVIVDIRFMHNMVAEMNDEVVNLLVCDPDEPRHLQYVRGTWVPASFVDKPAK